MNGGRQHVALVAPFFGRDLRGRKERFAFAYATHLALEGIALDVLTTTATGEAPDANFFQSGTDHTEPFPVHRFRVDAPDRVAYAEALLASRRSGRDRQDARPLLDERVRSPELLAHVRAAADRYDTFLFLDLTVPTTVRALPDVAERAILVPLLDDEPAARLRDVADAVAQARMTLCSSEAEAGLFAELYGPAARARTRIVGLGADAVPRDDLNDERVRRVTHGRPYVLLCGDDPRVLAELRSATLPLVVLDEIDERDRAAFFAFARVVAVAGRGLGFVPEVAEAWAYGKAVLAAADAPGAAALVREAGGGVVVAAGSWAASVDTLPGDDALSVLAREGAAYVESRGGWRRIAARTSEAIDALAALEDGRSRDALLAQVAYLYPIVQRQRRTIEAMRASRFWWLRDAWFAARRRFGIGPAADPIPELATVDRAVEMAALGDPYQLFREHHRLRGEDAERMRAMTRFFPTTVSFGLTIDARNGAIDGVRTTLRSLRDQVYEQWTARVLVDDGEGAESVEELRVLAQAETRIVLVPPGGDRFGNADVVGGLGPHDRLEPHALFEFALALQGDADVVYCDEDTLDDRGVPYDPWLKPDWSPETFLTRDYVGGLAVIRRELLEAAGGVRDVFESASWYEALLRVTDRTQRVAHIAQVLCHRYERNRVDPAEQALAVEVALRRRGETAEVEAFVDGVEVRYSVPGDERVTIVIPSRDRADLLGPCLTAVFERTTYANFEVMVVDNGSREEATQMLLAEWEGREPERFRVLRDPAPFNYSRLNNAAVAAVATPFVVLLNNDTEVVAPEWLAAMLGQARRTEIGAVGALLLYADGTVQHGGIMLGVLGLAGHAHRFLSGTSPGYHGGLQFDTNYLAVTGACMMVETRKFRQVGGLDESLAVSYNDVDLCLKLRQAGYRNVFVPRARLFHFESKSRGTDDTPAKVARALEEVEVIRSRWPRWAVRDPYYHPNLTVDAEDFGLRL